MAILPYELGPLEGLVAELDTRKARLDHRGVLPRTWYGRLRRDLEAEAVAASTSMEGVPVTVDDVRQILAGDRPAGVRDEDADLVRGHREAMSFVLRRADAPAFSWDTGLLVALHDRVLAGKWAAGAGRFRERPAYVVDNERRRVLYEPPAAEQVPELVATVCAVMERGHSHPAIGAAWIHIAVAAIHPFRDGNGRSARVLASLAMYRGGFKLPELTSLEEWWGRHVRDYYASFECLGTKFSEDAVVTDFLVAHLSAQLSQARALELRERVERQIWMALEQAVVDAGMEPRVANALWDAFFGREVTPRYYRPLADISVATATSDLAAAVAAGMLRPLGQGRSRRYVAGPRLFSTVATPLGIDVGEPLGAEDLSFIVAELTKRASS